MPEMSSPNLRAPASPASPGDPLRSTLGRPLRRGLCSRVGKAHVDVRFGKFRFSLRFSGKSAL
eukprot:572103-Pelagomonas_calceolata.AAC.1